MNFPMPNSITALFSSFPANMFLVVFLALTFVSIANNYPDLAQYGHSQFAKALSLKYPEVGLASPKGPAILDPNLKAEVVFRGLKYPTSMAFLGPNDMLVTEKDAGTVQRIINNTELQQPLLNVSVATYAHRGMLGIAVAPHSLTAENLPNHINSTGNHDDIAYVFLYYTQAKTHTGDDATEGKQPPGNLLYRYELINGKLVSPKLLLNLPATPGAIGNGGKVIIGPDNNVYLTIGSVGVNGHITKTQNIQNGSEPDGTSGILRVNQDGQPIPPGILGNEFPLNIYFSYGVWNSFGLAFDPITGILWDTQIGLSFGDEINLVESGFNSGYNKVDGIWLRDYDTGQTKRHVAPLHPDGLVDFGGKGRYHAPQFTWFQKVVPTGVAFLDSNTMGRNYQNDMFVSDAKNGNIYHFKLNTQRTGLLFSPGPLADGVANSSDSLDQIAFGKGFGAITDLKVSPYDGHLYVLTFDEKKGTIFRIVPISNQTSGRGG
jgi:glucose/arabinose dehydrogenase